MAFVMDNATNNDTMLRGIERRCHLAGIPFSARDARGRCMPHTIHLSAILVSHDFMSTIYSLLTRTHYFGSSCRKRKQYRQQMHMMHFQTIKTQVMALLRLMGMVLQTDLV